MAEEKNQDLDLDSTNGKFLKEWFSSLFEGIQRLNDETWPKVLVSTGRVCAKVHSADLFQSAWIKAEGDLDIFIKEINEIIAEKSFVKLNENTISVTYTECSCPLVKSGLVDSPVICECSPNWLIENFETIFDDNVTVTSHGTILRGATTCNFIVSLDS